MKQALCILAVLFLATATIADARTITLKADGTGEFPAIQAAVDAAEDGDVIRLKKGVYRGDGNRDIEFFGKAITVRGHCQMPERVVINPEGTPEEPHRGFAFQNGETVDAVVEGLTIAGGYSPAGATANVGGAISFISSSATIRKCILVDNLGEFGGGAVSIILSSPVFTDCVFERNEAIDFGGGAIAGAVFSFPVFERCAFIDNVAFEAAGAIGAAIPGFLDDPSVFTLTDCYFSGNRAGDRNGAVGFANGVSMLMTRCVFVDNEAGATGGAVQAAGNPDGTDPALGLLSLTDCVFANNTAPIGAALHASVPTVEIRGCTFAANTASESAVVWFNEPATTATIENTIVAFSSMGAAIDGVDGVTLTLSCSDVFGNAGGDYVGLIAGLEGIDGNISDDPLFCGPMEFDFSLGEDSPCLPEETGCGLMGAHPEGCDDPEDVDDDDDGDDDDRLADPMLDGPAVQLGAIRPNPFTGSTTVSFTLPEAREVTLAAYDVRGRQVAMLVQGVRPAGDHTLVWNGRDRTGRPVVPGMYFVRLQAGTIVQTQEVVLTR